MECAVAKSVGGPDNRGTPPLFRKTTAGRFSNPIRDLAFPRGKRRSPTGPNGGRDAECRIKPTVVTAKEVGTKTSERCGQAGQSGAHTAPRPRTCRISADPDDADVAEAHRLVQRHGGALGSVMPP